MAERGKRRAPLVFSADLGRHFGESLASSLSQQPGGAPNPTLHVASRRCHEALQPSFRQAKIAGPAQAMRTDQFALGSLDSVAPPRFELKGLCALFSPP